MTLLFLSVLGITVVNSCKSFCQCDVVTNDDFNCKLLNSQGQNLVAGPQAVYRYDSIRVLRQRNDLSSQIGKVTRAYFDSGTLNLPVDVNQTKVYLYYAQQTANDSLEITWNAEKKRCCGDPYTYRSLKQVKFNGSVVEPQNRVYLLTK